MADNRPMLFEMVMKKHSVDMPSVRKLSLKVMLRSKPNVIALKKIYANRLLL